jgi:hypothetical protein
MFSFIAKAKAAKPSKREGFRRRRLSDVPSNEGSCQFHTVNYPSAFDLQVENGAIYG